MTHSFPTRRSSDLQRVALINGEPVDLSPQVYLFLKILEDADGDEVHKRHMADGLGLQPGASFRTADIFKRHKQVYATFVDKDNKGRSEEHTSELQSLMRISYAVFCLKKKNN